jgi:hypothetical protein
MTDEPTAPLPAADAAAPASTTAPAASAGPASTAGPAAPPSTAGPAGPRLRVGTVVWGLVLAVLGVAVLAWAAGADVDGQLALIVLLGGAGVALLVGSLISGLRASRR